MSTYFDEPSASHGAVPTPVSKTWSWENARGAMGLQDSCAKSATMDWSTIDSLGSDHFHRHGALNVNGVDNTWLTATQPSFAAMIPALHSIECS